MTATTYRIVLAPFQPVRSGVQSVVGELASRGLSHEQLCLIGKVSSIASLSSFVGSVYPNVVADLEQFHIGSPSSQVVASLGQSQTFCSNSSPGCHYRLRHR